jgi:hypothetical protein
MSDTSLDIRLDNKRSTRYPGWLERRIKRFRQEYNEVLDEEFAINDVSKFRLENDSEAIRRLLDIGLAEWFDGEKPMGFGFEADEDVQCPSCYVDDPAKFRAGIAPESDDPEDYTGVLCLACGAEQAYGDFEMDEAGPFDGLAATE